MIHALAWDIETVPTARALALPYPAEDRQPPASYKKPESIAEWRVNDRAAWETDRIKGYSLSPLTGRVVCVGMAWHDYDGGLQRDSLLAVSDADERVLLGDFWARMRTAEKGVTFNGIGFDAPFMLLRSAILGVLPSIDARELLKRYSYEFHYDVRMALTSWDMRARGTLNDACAAFGIPGKSGSGADVWPLVQAGRFDDLAEYAMDDAERTLTLYDRLNRVIG